MNYYHKTLRLLSLGFIWLLAYLPFWAKPISKSQALKLAGQYINAPVLKTLTAQTRSFAKEKNPSFYLFDNANGKGFVIISGESSMDAIVGYSTEGDMSNASLPEPMVELLQNYAHMVKEVREGKRKASVPTLTKYAAVAPMIKTRWGQSNPFNLYTPLQNNQRTLTGCVATAMSQLMYFHKWPQKRYKNAPVEVQEHSQLKDVYDWNLMQERYGYRYENTEASAVATLMRDAGTSVKMQYGLRGSGAYVSDAVYALRDSFQYDVRYLLREGMSANHYKDELMAELAKGYPVFGKGGEHAWMFDGYNEDGLVHVNWGWNGFYNGYFDLSVIGVNEVGDGGGSGKYWTDQEMIFVRPKDGKHELFTQPIKRLTFYNNGSISFASTQVLKRIGLSASFTNIGTTNFKQDSSSAFKGLIGAAMYDANKNLVKVFTASSRNTQWEGVYERMRLSRWYWDMTDVNSGEYIIIPVSKALIKEPDEYAEWTPFENAPEIKIKVDERFVTVVSPTTEPVFTLESTPIMVNEVYEKGVQTGIMSFSVNNVSGKEYRGFLRFNLSGNKREFNYEPPQDTQVSLIERNGVSHLTLHLPSIYNDEGIKDTLVAGTYTLGVQFVYRDESGTQTIYNIEGLQNYELRVLPKPSHGLISIRQMQLYLNNIPTSLHEINRADSAEVSIALKLNVNKVDRKTSYQGNLIYSLEELETGEVIDMTRINNLVLTVNDADFNSQTKVNLNLSALKEHSVYMWRVYREENNKRTLVAHNKGTQRYLMVFGTQNTTGINSIEKIPIGTFVVYNLQGVRLQQSWNHLPTGIYIVNGKKIYKH